LNQNNYLDTALALPNSRLDVPHKPHK